MKLEYLVWLLKGAAMGVADAVPGVSGGTIALLLGIYRRLINALASIRLDLLAQCFRGNFKEVFKQIDGLFLLCLGTGILISLFTVLNIMHWLLNHYAPLVWSAFFGLILASLVSLGRQQVWRMRSAVLFVLGALASAGLSLLTSLPVVVNPLTLVFGGMIAISAMLLPGISGSFMLLILGLYPVVVEAIHDRDLLVVFWVGLGCGLGILLFSRFLNWLLTHWYHSVMAFLLGVIAGALLKVWPWQFDGKWMLPNQYRMLTGEDSLLIASLVVFAVTLMLVFSLPKMPAQSSQPSSKSVD